MKKKQTERVEKKGGGGVQNYKGAFYSYFTQKNGTSVSDVLVSVLFFNKVYLPLLKYVGKYTTYSFTKTYFPPRMLNFL
jgi:DNA-binding protein Fis